MKKLILAIAILSISTLSYAQDQGPANKVGGKVDMPNLVRFSENLTLGVEASKDVYQRLNSGWVHEDGDRGYAGYVKVTYSGSLLNFAK